MELASLTAIFEFETLDTCEKLAPISFVHFHHFRRGGDPGLLSSHGFPD